MAELPRGTVTFLFTDVESSTRLLREHMDAYPHLIAEHRGVLDVGLTSSRTFRSTLWEIGWRDAVGPSGGAWADGGAQLRPDGDHAVGGGGGCGDAIGQIWRSRRGGGSLA